MAILEVGLGGRLDATNVVCNPKQLRFRGGGEEFQTGSLCVLLYECISYAFLGSEFL